MSEPRLPLLLRVREVMTELACSRSHVYDLLAREELSYVQDGRMKRVTRESLLAYIKRHSRRARGVRPVDGAEAG